MKLRSWYLGFTKLERLWLGIQVWMQTSYFGSIRKEIKPEGEQPSPKQRIAAERGLPREDDVEDGGLPRSPHRPERAQVFVLPVVCFRRACPFLMAWSTFFFLFTISSFKAWRERQLGLPFCGQVPKSCQLEILRSPRTAPTEHEKGGQQIGYLSSHPSPATGVIGTSGTQRLKS